MTINLWHGQLVRLRGIEPNDWQHFHTWNFDTEVARFCYHIPFPGSEEQAKRFATEQAQQSGQNDIFRFMIETVDGTPVGSLNTHSCEARHGSFKYGLSIARPHWRKGYASEAIRLVLGYFFVELRYQKCTVHVYSFNPASIRLHETLGFQHEGRLRRMIYTDGAYHDELVMGITVEEFHGN